MKLNQLLRLVANLSEIVHEEVANLVFRSVAPDEQLLESGLLDSITVVDLSVALEEHLDIKIPFTDIDATNFQTVNSICNYLQTLIP
ncbi:MAG: phosphopantetheine-binding protein [Salibacteraceae bacterium]